MRTTRRLRYLDSTVIVHPGPGELNPHLRIPSAGPAGESNGRAPEIEPIRQYGRGSAEMPPVDPLGHITVHAGKEWPAESAPDPAHGAEWWSLLPCKYRYAIPFQVTDGSEWVPVSGACMANFTLMAIVLREVRLIPSHFSCCVQIMHGSSAIRLSRFCRQGRPELWNTTSENPRRSTEGSVISSASTVSTLSS